jgi:hypothetical protein
MNSGQRPFQTFHRAELQRLDAAGVLQHVEEQFNLPTGAIPVDEFGCCLEAGGLAVGEQPPFDGLHALRGAHLAGHEAGGLQATSRAVGPAHTCWRTGRAFCPWREERVK